MNTKQLNTWTKNFGKEYNKRNEFSLKGLDQLYKTYFGITRTQMNQTFLKGINKNSRILEVGTNIGNQLELLQKMGFKNLYGIEPQTDAVERAKQRTTGINIIQGNAFDLPFKDGFFDLVFTSGVLIHISPKDISRAINEIIRCSNKYIWGFEYYAEKYTEILYRGKKNLLWKTDFPALYLKTAKNLKLLKSVVYPYKTDKNEDVMFLLKKKNGR